MRFDSLGVHAALHADLDARGYDTATPVQQAVLAPELADADLLVSSQTGSGKTIAFGLAAAHQLLGESQHLGRAAAPRVLVVAPTRELAQQVARELSWLYRGAGARVATCVGGMDIRREQRALHDGAHIVVGTPGRLCDHLARAALDLSQLAVVVLDEADEMLDMGFQEDLEKILDAAPGERRTLMFSATIPREIEALARKYTKDAHRVRANAAESHADIEYLAHAVAPQEREHAVVNVLRFHEPPSALVFCATREGVFHLHASLQERGFSVVSLSGELSQAERNRSLHAMRDGRARVLVATDVAARGLDLPTVALVVHADLPQNEAALLHRSGRTGRAGRKGTSVVLVPYNARRYAERLFRGAHVDVSIGPAPTMEQIRALDTQRLVERVGALTAEADVDDAELVRALCERHGAEALAVAVARLERRALPAAEDLPLTASLRARGERGEGTARRERPRVDGRGNEDTHGARRPVRHVASADGRWFHVNVGRKHNADPRWLLPMLCRRGGVKKGDIGRIEIGASETRFEVATRVAHAFAEAAARPDRKDKHVRIQALRDDA
ncbi:MAG: DEAD/DEAH box helicase [Deltaproteobacteria bacterium]|nr:DEAD/DEAH box helicase [Deltaproteobacteria bacterium]